MSHEFLKSRHPILKQKFVYAYAPVGMHVQKVRMHTHYFGIRHSQVLLLKMEAAIKGCSIPAGKQRKTCLPLICYFYESSYSQLISNNDPLF